MQTMLKTALDLACIESGAGHNVMVLVPDKSWMGGRPMTSELSDVRGTVYTRCTTRHSGLKMVAIDTLILVAPGSPTWDAEGEAYARERLRTSLDPRVIKVGEGPPPAVCFDCGKQRNPTRQSSFDRCRCIRTLSDAA